ncbi:MAG: trans-acting enoyl reductase family protein [Halobacteria archaeon]
MILIYGSYGYTGDLISRYAVERDEDVVLAGRNGDELREQGDELGLPTRKFDADEAEANLDGVDVVLNCAGPFSRTYEPILDACLGEGADYLDITGEIEVFRAAVGATDEAKEQGVTLMPGVGFDVVPTDCLAFHVSRRVENPRKMEIFVEPSGKLSHGTAQTALESLGEGGWVLRDGMLKRKPIAWRTDEIEGRKGVAVPLADVVTGFYTTGVGDIDTYVLAPGVMRKAMKASRYLGKLPGRRHIKNLFSKAVERTLDGPDESHRKSENATAWCRVVGADRETAVSRLRTPETYRLTKLTALESAVRADGTELEGGFKTPASVWGADYVTEFEGVERTDL